MTTALSLDTLRQTVPSVFATRPVDGVSSRYAFLPTSEVVEIMQDAGFFPVKASQTLSRLPDQRPFARHMIRFRPAEYLNPGLHTELPEIILSNSHDKTAAYSLSAGIHRLICRNGLTVSSASLGAFSIRHGGNRDIRKQIIDTTAEIAAAMPKVMETVNQWKQIIMPRWQQIEFAEQAHALKPHAAIRPVFLLTARRPEDMTLPDGSRDLFRTLNVCQEAIMQGGLQGRNARGRQIKTRPVKSVMADLFINKRLWRLAEQVAEWN